MEQASATFTLPIPRDGLYDVRLSFPALPANAQRARFEVIHAGGTAVETIGLRDFGYWPRLGRYRFRPGQPARVILHARDADGQVAIEALGFVRVAN